MMPQILAAAGAAIILLLGSLYLVGIALAGSLYALRIVIAIH